jgi:5-deoxy-D-glucuronate isomerase
MPKRIAEEKLQKETLQTATLACAVNLNSKEDNVATCAGCGKDHTAFPVYNSDMNTVEEDGSYANNRFVCDDCYVVLINMGLDKGTPQELQQRARRLCFK